MHRRCFVWTLTPRLWGRRTPRPVPVRVWVSFCALFLAGSGKPASRAHFCVPHFFCGRCCCLLPFLGPLQAGVALYLFVSSFRSLVCLFSFFLLPLLALPLLLFFALGPLFLHPPTRLFCFSPPFLSPAPCVFFFLPVCRSLCSGFLSPPPLFCFLFSSCCLLLFALPLVISACSLLGPPHFLGGGGC